jgi:hypothetical protein
MAQFGTGLMTIAAEGDPGGRPVVAECAAIVAGRECLPFPGRRLAKPQQDRHRTRSGRIVDMDRQKAALVAVRVADARAQHQRYRRWPV